MKGVMTIFFVILPWFIGSGTVWFFWNAVLLDLFHAPKVSYVQALGLFVLARVVLDTSDRYLGGRHV